MELAESVGLVEHFKLYSQISINNMHLFDKDGRIQRFQCPLEIIEDFFPLRYIAALPLINPAAATHIRASEQDGVLRQEEKVAAENVEQ
jgi:hypothetical protein